MHKLGRNTALGSLGDNPHYRDPKGGLGRSGGTWRRPKKIWESQKDKKVGSFLWKAWPSLQAPGWLFLSSLGQELSRSGGNKAQTPLCPLPPASQAQDGPSREGDAREGHGWRGTWGRRKRGPQGCEEAEEDTRLLDLVPTSPHTHIP